MPQSKLTTKVCHPRYSLFQSNRPLHAILSHVVLKVTENTSLVKKDCGQSHFQAIWPGNRGRLTLAAYYWLAQSILKVGFALAKKVG